MSYRTSSGHMPATQLITVARVIWWSDPVSSHVPTQPAGAENGGGIEFQIKVTRIVHPFIPQVVGWPETSFGVLCKMTLLALGSL